MSKRNWTSEDLLSDLDPMEALQHLRHDYDLCRPVDEFFMAQVMRQLKKVLDEGEVETCKHGGDPAKCTA